MSAKKGIAMILLVLVLSTMMSTMVSASMVYVNGVRSGYDRFYFGNVSGKYTAKYDCFRYNLATMRSKCYYTHYTKFYLKSGTTHLDHACSATDSYSRRTTGWKWAKCYTHYSVATVKWYKASGYGIYRCRWDGAGNGYTQYTRYN